MSAILPPLQASIVLDASVAARWFLPYEKPLSLDSSLLMDKNRIAPSILHFELLSLLCKNYRLRKIDNAQINIALSDLHTMIQEEIMVFYPLTEYEQSAIQIACEIKHPFYDCCYLALAKQENCPLITADKQLAERGNIVHSDIILV